MFSSGSPEYSVMNCTEATRGSCGAVKMTDGKYRAVLALVRSPRIKQGVIKRLGLQRPGGKPQTWVEVRKEGAAGIRGGSLAWK